MQGREGPTLTDQPKRILLADDNEVFAKTLCFNLDSAGYDTTIASNGTVMWRIRCQTFAPSTLAAS